MALLFYVVKVNFCVTLLYSIYWILFRNTTFFFVNRFYLLGGLLISWIIPALNFTVVVPDTHSFPASLAIHNAQTDLVSDAISLATQNIQTEYNFIPIIYWVVTTLFLCRLLYACTRITILRRRSKRLGTNETIYQSNINEPFTFLKWVFLPYGKVDPIVLQHELQHVHQMHFIDLLFVEISFALLWFNPVMIMYHRSIKMQHEYAADAGVASSSSVKTYLEALAAHLQMKTMNGPFSFFYSTHLKQRILMITRKRTSPFFTLAYSVSAPIVIALMITLSSARFDSYDVPVDDDRMTIILDAGHGGNDSGTIYDSRVSEKELALSLAKAIQKEAKTQNIRVIMTRSRDVGVSLEERVNAAQKNKADVFISLHVNSDKENSNTSGITCMVSDRNVKFDDSRLIAEKLMNSFSALSDVQKNGIVQSPAYVLSKNPIPSLILEVGYLTNESDYAFLTSPEKVRALAERLVSALKK